MLERRACSRGCQPPARRARTAQRAARFDAPRASPRSPAVPGSCAAAARAPDLTAQLHAVPHPAGVRIGHVCATKGSRINLSLNRDTPDIVHAGRSVLRVTSPCSQLARGTAQVATPALLPLPGPHGHYRRGYGLVLFLNSRGEVTAYHPYGERAWQARAPSAHALRTCCLPAARQQPPQRPCCCLGLAQGYGACSCGYCRFALSRIPRERSFPL